MNDDLNSLWKSLSLLLRSHPWHGIPIGEEYPDVVNTYIETVPSDTVKYEIDKKSGFLKNVLAVTGELLCRVTTGNVTLLRAKRPADAPLCSTFSMSLISKAFAPDSIFGRDRIRQTIRIVA